MCDSGATLEVAAVWAMGKAGREAEREPRKYKQMGSGVCGCWGGVNELISCYCMLHEIKNGSN